MATLILLNDETGNEHRLDGLTDDQVDYASKNSWRYTMPSGANGWLIPILDNPPSHSDAATPGTVDAP